MNKNLRNKLIVGFALAFAVFIGLILYGDIQEMGQLLSEFQWSLIPAILGLTMLNYILRGIRFHYYIRQLGIKSVSFWTTLLIFIGGFSLTLTPGKVGELIRVIWLKKLANVDPVKTAPLLIADRVADGLAMSILAVVGAMAYPKYKVGVLFLLAFLVTGVVISQIRPLVLWFLKLGERLPVVSKFVHHLHVLYESSYLLLQFKNLLVGVGIGLLAWASEGMAFYLVLTGLGLPGSFNLALLSVFVLALGSIIGGASAMPGGLGAAEASMTGMLQALIGLPGNLAATATLLIRFFTLWFGVTLGILVVAIWRKKLFGSDETEELTLQIIEPVYEQTTID